MVMGDPISRLSFPGRRIVCHSKKTYAALISWNIYLFTKACLHFSEENTKTFSSLTSYPELRRSKFLIGGYVGAKASLLSTIPPFVAMTQELVARGDTLRLFAPFCHPEAAGPMTSRDQVWSFCTLVSSRGGGSDDTRRYPSGYPHKHSFAICKTERLIACRGWHSLLHLLFLREQQSHLHAEISWSPATLVNREERN